MKLQDMEALRIQAGDMLVLRPTSMASSQQLAEMQSVASHYTEALGIKILVVQHGIDVYAVRQEQAEP